jgi:hypothetical protein
MAERGENGNDEPRKPRSGLSRRSSRVAGCPRPASARSRVRSAGPARRGQGQGRCLPRLRRWPAHRQSRQRCLEPYHFRPPLQWNLAGDENLSLRNSAPQKLGPRDGGDVCFRARRDRSARCEHHHDLPALEPGVLLDLGDIGDVALDLVQELGADLLVRHLAAAIA